jgi:hypothetical protein
MRNSAAILTFAILLALGATAPAAAQTPPPSPAGMGPLARYLIADSHAEIALARSAAPRAISNKATVLVLHRSGYQIAIRGTNGFTCLVERSWMSPFDSPEFWNPRIRGPICYNPPAVQSILPYTINRTNLALAGLPKAAMHAHIAAAVAAHQLPPPAPGAMSYMMSKGGFLSNAAGHWYPHLMFHIRTTSAMTWGADVDGSPVLYNDQYQDMPEGETIFMIPVGHWSDGTPAPAENSGM